MLVLVELQLILDVLVSLKHSILLVVCITGREGLKQNLHMKHELYL